MTSTLSSLIQLRPTAISLSDPHSYAVRVFKQRNVNSLTHRNLIAQLLELDGSGRTDAADVIRVAAAAHVVELAREVLDFGDGEREFLLLLVEERLDLLQLVACARQSVEKGTKILGKNSRKIIH